ncbi:MAG TPA: EcsC family protein [Thermoanaerobaculia bacterium]|nr:EcsC family protein [Thermoanaerobaculia bacterium]
MGKVRRLKQRADSMLEEVFRSLFEEIDTEKIRRDVAVLKESEPDFQSRDHARLLVRRTALRCAAAGAISGLPGGLMAIGSLGAELAFLVFQQFRLIVGIATVYGHEPTQRERFAEAMSCLAYASGVGIGRQGIATVLESATMEGGVIAEKLGANFFRERLAKAIPFVGVVSGGALNYVSVRAVGRAAIRFYESQIDAGVADEIWAEGDREHA